ncbi:MAG: glycosyltransferase family 2 protein [Lachnospiraceae bacterium]|jgi:glycosyltransferase involved in cell wall biosynthesis|nr:glycosyltransferase family 2 protein [Lachnospiraceae bacterium]MCI9448508.1 glycosyltransferase family 2 protein [Lachnospiraceae bacterium]
MKLLSVAIPCYNSADYMEHAVETLLTGGEDMEIIIVDDGSKDETAVIADKLAARYPTMIKAIHQENGGHGQAVNTGLAAATGIYFKVVDSDDWVDTDALEKVLELLRSVVEEGKSLDMLICNYVYENVYLKKQRVMNYHTAMPRDCFFTWSDIKHFKASQYILMHSVFYRTKLLKKCGLQLPKHTFYVDNIFVYDPLPYVKTMYYLDVDFYRYFIGRADQSVNEKNMIARIDQQIRVTKHMIGSHDLPMIKNKKLRNYMTSYLCMMMVISSVFLIKSGSKENLAKKQELWDYLKKENPKMYKAVHNKLLGRSMNLPGKSGRKIIVLGYSISRKIYGFG